MLGSNFLLAVKKEINALRYLIRHRMYVSAKTEKDIVEQFHKLYYDSHIFRKAWGDTFWLGTPTQKCPLDIWIYQEIISEIKPDVVIECGTKYGGSALFLASMCDLLHHGEVITIDIEDKKNKPQHPRIHYLLGSSTSPAIMEQVKKLIRNKEKVLVILDSDHSKEHVLNELKLYSPLVTSGSYLIAEDTNINGHPVYSDFGPGPMEAVQEFLKDNKNFVIDKSKEKFYLSFNPNGYLKKVA